MFLLDLLYLSGLVLLAPWLIWRAVRTGRYRRDLAGKLFGISALSNQDSRSLAWFHGVSVGEIHLLVTVVKAFRERFPNWRVVVSSTTDTGLSEARTRFPDLQVIPFPFDFSWAVHTTLLSLKPKLLVLAESELWPNLLHAASEHKIPVAVINTRLSARSFARWYRIRYLARRLIFPNVTLWAVQSAEYADRLLALGVKQERLSVTGSVKYDGASGERDTPKARELRRLLGLSDNPSTLIWVAGSTHAPEESLVLQVFCRLQPRFPTLRLILVPRHPDRFQEVADLVQASGLQWVRRSELSQPLAAVPSVLLLDTVGELGAAWSLADVGFTGGSLDGRRGGQSMIEPAGFGVPTIFGPHVWNFRDAANRLVEAGAAVRVKDVEGLEVELAKLLADEPLRQEMGQAARKLVEAQQGATRRTLDAISQLICE
jgi:3-deoxy-D-manno-octulosonic-acid transferase